MRFPTDLIKASMRFLVSLWNAPIRWMFKRRWNRMIAKTDTEENGTPVGYHCRMCSLQSRAERIDRGHFPTLIRCPICTSGIAYANGKLKVPKTKARVRLFRPSFDETMAFKDAKTRNYILEGGLLGRLS